MSDHMLHSNMRYFLSELMLPHTKICNVRTYVAHEYEMCSVRTYVTYQNVICPNLCMHENMVPYVRKEVTHEMGCVLSELKLHTKLQYDRKICFVRTYVTDEYEMFSIRTNVTFLICYVLSNVTHKYEMFSVQTYVTFENVMCPKLCYIRKYDVLCQNLCTYKKL